MSAKDSNSGEGGAYAHIMGQLLRPVSALTSKAGTSGAAPAEPLPVLSDDPLVRVREARNPLLAAAGPLLRALAELPDIQEVEQADALRQALVREVQLFQSLCDRAYLRREHVVTVRYCLCTALDEAVGRQTWGQAWARDGAWSDKSLLLLFHNETSGGEKFFLLLGRMAQASAEHLHPLEVLYRILSLGFEGRYALSPDGVRQLETIHRRLLSILAGHIPAPPQELSPHWQGAGKGRLPLLRHFPVWITASVLGLGLVALFLSLSAQLDRPAAALEQKLHALSTLPLTPQKRLLPLPQWFSAAELKRYALEVDAGKDIVRLVGSAAFNGADMVAGMAPALDKLARLLVQQLSTTGGRIAIVGHTDDTPLRAGSRFRDNQHLSEERARSVARALTARGVQTARISTEGRGATNPLADNATAAGKARNRRVDIVLLPASSARSAARSEAVKTGAARSAAVKTGAARSARPTLTPPQEPRP